MRYFKVKKIVDEYTTKSLVVNDSETHYRYDEKDSYEYFGVETEDANFLARQHPECEVTEMSFAEIESILRGCKMYSDINFNVKVKIAENYDVAKEIEMQNRKADDPSDAEYLEYRAYRDDCLNWGHNRKVELGLKLSA